jgi:hypothetical protein
MSACPSTHRPAARYRLAAGGACTRHATFSRQLLRTSLPLAAVVGTVLTLINQGTLLFSGNFPADLAWKVPLTYSVPFLVSTWSQLRALRIG